MQLFPIRLVAASFVLVAALAGCGGGDSPAPVPDVSGQWSPPSFVPGSAFQFTLRQQGTDLTGTGTFAIEAGANGTLTVTGSAAQDGDVNLVFRYSIGWVTTFTGSMTSPGVLKGSLVRTDVNDNTPPATAEFDRTGP